MTLQAKLIALVVAFLCGLLLGVVAMHYVQQAGLAAQLKAQIAADQQVMDKRIEDERAVAKQVTAQLDQERSKTSTLNGQLADLRATNQSLTEQITDAQFHPAPQVVPSHPAVVCPGHPVASPEFLQLYDAAAGATGGAAHGASSG